METILLIEDDKDVLENLIEFLEMEDYKVHFSKVAGLDFPCRNFYKKK